jgi:hypothetical protein
MTPQPNDPERARNIVRETVDEVNRTAESLRHKLEEAEAHIRKLEAEADDQLARTPNQIVKDLIVCGYYLAVLRGPRGSLRRRLDDAGLTRGASDDT